MMSAGTYAASPNEVAPSVKVSYAPTWTSPLITR